MSLGNLVISDKRLGEGGFGTVFMSQLDGMKVAAKKLSQSEREFDNLVREASRFKKLQYGKHIAYIHGITLKDENLYMVMEYGRFGDLKSFLNQNAGSVAYERKILFCRGILLGLMYCHSMNIFHGDIKCSNVILGKNLEPKLTDFGLSMTVDNIEYYSKPYDGSLYWVAPELFSIKEDEAVYQGFIADPYPCDVYSLGAIFCEISYDGTTEFIDSDDPETDIMLELVSPIPKNAFLEEVVKNCCQFERNERISLECCFSILENITEEQLPIPAVNDKWQLIQQDIKANSKLKLPPSFILHRPAGNLVMGPSNLLLLEWLCINNCIDAVKYMVQLHEYDEKQIKWLYEISELCKSPEVTAFIQTLMQNSEPSHLVLSSLIDNHPQQFIEILIKVGASSCSYILLKKAIERHHNMTVQAIIDSRNHLKNWAAYNAVKFGNAEAVKILANVGADLEWRDKNTGYTPLKMAIETENIKIVKILLEHDVDVNGGNCYTQGDMGVEIQCRPLYLAALKDNREIVKLLINSGATMDITSSQWHSLSQSLEQQGNINMVYFICNTISKRSSSMKNNTLCAAIQNKQLNLVQKLISNREKVDEIGLDGYTPLHCTVIVGDEETVKNLIRAGADLDVRTSNEPQNLHSVTDCFNECTPLHIAVSKKHLGIARLLIEAGADFSAKNGLQQTVIDIAKEDKKEIKKIIMEYAPVNVISIRRAMKSMSHKTIKIMINKQVNAEILSECLCTTVSNGENDLVKYLVKYGVKINEEHRGKTPLECAIFWGNIEAMKILINARVNVKIKKEHQEASLFQCIKELQLDMIQFLLDQGTDGNTKDKYGYAPIHYVNNKEILRILINAGVDINARDPYGETCLVQYVKNSDTEMVQFLVDKGADVNANDEYGYTPIHYTKSKDVLEVLINAGADINAKNWFGGISLIQHVKESDTKIVQFLLDQGADVNTSDKGGNAPIHYAKNKDILKILINAGADINAKDQYEKTCLIQHVRESNTEMVQFLVDKGADLDSRDKDGNAPIHYANGKDILEILINAGTDIDAKDHFKRLWLTQYMKKSDIKIGRFMVDQGVDGNTPIHIVNISTKDKYRAIRLIQYVRESNTEMVKFLVDRGVDVNVSDNDGNIPIDYANNKDILEILVNAGANINVGIGIDRKDRYEAARLIQHVKKSDTEMVRFLIDDGVCVNARDEDGNASIHYANSKSVLKVLINAGANINAKDQNGKICLVQHVRDANIEMVQFLVNQGADVNAKDKYENTPIHYTNNKGVLEILINAGADINAKDQYGKTCLIQHVRESNTEIVKFLVDKGADVNASDKHGDTPIHFVRDKETAELLVMAGADINAKGQYGTTCIIRHVKKSDTEVVQFLVDKGADINDRDENENAPIHYANSKDILKTLINAGADFNAKDWFGTTCLIQYVKKSDIEMVQFLVDKGVDVNAKDKYGNAPIHYANNMGVLEILINAGVDINAKDRYGRVYLTRYVEKLDTKIVQFLVDKGADVNARDKDRNAPIHYANSKNILKILINAGADINAKDRYGTTHLIQYVRKSNTKMVQFLVDKRADVNARDKDGNIPIHYIRDKKIAEIFVTAGADINIKNKYKKALINILIEEQNRNLSNSQYKRKNICKLLEYLRDMNKV